MTNDRNKAARELLAFYAEAGVDAAIGEEPNDLLSAPPVAPAAAPVAERTAPRPAEARLSAVPARRVAAPPPPPDSAIMAARDAARRAASLDELRSILGAFD